MHDDIKSSTPDGRFEYVPCNLCGSREYKPLFTSRDYLFYSSETFFLVQCSTCGLVFMNPRPLNMDYYYRDYHRKILDKDLLMWLVPDRARKITQVKRCGTLLDVGCGTGAFLHSMSKLGWEVYGNDTSQHACDYAKNELGLKNVFCGSLISADLPQDYFDMITLWHVLEHLKEPRQTLEKIRLLLKDDGILVIESPDFSSVQSKIFKSKWYGLDLPRHLYQVSPVLLKKMASTAGLAMYKRDYFVNPRFNFIALKMSLLRVLGMRSIPDVSGVSGAEHRDTMPQRTLKRKITGFVFNYLILFVSFLLSLVNSKDAFRIYCKKNKSNNT